MKVLRFLGERGGIWSVCHVLGPALDLIGGAHVGGVVRVSCSEKGMRTIQLSIDGWVHL